MSNNPENLAEYFANIITSKHNQHCQIRFVGKAGMSKSTSAIELGMGVAEEVAKIKGGSASDYFSFEKDLAVMSTDEVERVMNNPGKYHVILLDDIATAVGARDFQKNSNKELAKIIQTFRPNNNLVIETLQASFLVDKIFRLLAHYEIEMESTNFDMGYAIGKVQEIVYKHKTDEIHYPYIFIDGKRYVRHIFQSPPKEIMDRYEAERAKQLAKIMEKQPENTPENNKIYVKDTVLKLHNDWKNGLMGDLSFKQVCAANQIKYDSANSIVSKELNK